MSTNKTEGLVDFAILSMKYKTKLTKKFENRVKYTDPNPNHIMSYIPGTICEIFVKEGQKVKEGESLLILEAMKMRNQITMPHTGVVKSIKVATGDRIPKNQLMVEIE
ncbi:biotin/lipoyl-containing protein [Carboxylicivirga sp. M1479]|uniref:biotin/lipoyl-containing protein n=1 Tax=Carboxylicivirga sp. M1479 TaxID=2594476 RepID=UPI001177AF0E|nr:acetyl-CoA carboxylase biotin carboxyl carrier protein subunit [Carboxylicivirga sp. M1479]TRX71554.1 acetyl-CoA carboxylase biotin carboxyl carrier protein subunit [Carboxylicivirga sp. M1479]